MFSKLDIYPDQLDLRKLKLVIETKNRITFEDWSFQESELPRYFCLKILISLNNQGYVFPTFLSAIAL